jgi:UDP-galactopyranose mutase
VLNNQAIVTFSHLRWEFVYQRPQHLLSRLAARRPVIFIEESVPTTDGEPTWEYSTPAPGITVCRLHTAAPTSGFHDSDLPVFIPMLHRLLEEERCDNYLAWLYTPMALPLAQALSPALVVYDCMDELSVFLNAPRDLLDREAALLGWADLVFTGGPSLYRSKRDRHPSVHCFPSSVDAAHFRQAHHLPDADDQAALPHPRLGFYGVIDERLDTQLLGALAEAHPEWQIVIVGPVVKIDPAVLPRHSNIHYLGPRAYSQLPAYLAGWDVCLLPFARNEATRFISPTKTLEYMAAERPIVSTPITDVAGPYGGIVYLGDTAETFVAACERALAAGAGERAERVARMRDVLSRTSWDATARVMEGLIDAALQPLKVREWPETRSRSAVAT